MVLQSKLFIHCNQLYSLTIYFFFQPSAFATPSVGTTISVEPPSPVVMESAASAKMQVFPSIPPLMHSAGMTAPPLNPQPATALNPQPGVAPGGSSVRTTGTRDLAPYLSPKGRESGTTPTTTTTTTTDQQQQQRGSDTQEVHTPPHSSGAAAANISVITVSWKCGIFAVFL